MEVVSRRFRLQPGDEVILVVGRMDRIKGQDVAIRALAEVVREHPRLKLVLVGNGSFSGSKSGLGLSKSARWKEHLQKIAHELDVSDHLVFTGYVNQRELDCLYERARATLLPSTREGFGLVVVESWLHRKPALVSERAGISELAREISKEILFDPDDPPKLAEKLARLLRGNDSADRRLAERGMEVAQGCLLDTAVKAETGVIEEVLGA